MVKPDQGDIYWVKFGHSGDSGPSGKRPSAGAFLALDRLQGKALVLVIQYRSEIPPLVFHGHGLFPERTGRVFPSSS